MVSTNVVRVPVRHSSKSDGWIEPLILRYESKDSTQDVRFNLFKINGGCSYAFNEKNSSFSVYGRIGGFGAG